MVTTEARNHLARGRPKTQEYYPWRQTLGILGSQIPPAKPYTRSKSYIVHQHTRLAAQDRAANSQH